jgi:hypothetical protein
MRVCEDASTIHWIDSLVRLEDLSLITSTMPFTPKKGNLQTRRPVRANRRVHIGRAARGDGHCGDPRSDHLRSHGGVRAAQNQPQAKAEPAAMAQALERFKTTYGFYPHAEETKYRQPVSGGLKK